MAQINFGLLDTSLPEKLGAAPANAFAAFQQQRMQQEDRAFQREQAMFQREGQQTQNALARLQMQQAQRTMDADEAVRTAAAGGGEWEDVINRVRGVDPAKALELETKVGNVRKTSADAKAAVTKQAWDKLERYRQVGLQSVATPQQYASWLHQQHTDPELAPVMSMLPPLEESLRTIPSDPAQFEQFRQRGMLGMEKWLQLNKPTDFERTMDMAQLSPSERTAAARARLTKETTHAPGNVTNVNMALEREEQKAKGKSNVELYGTIRDTASTARKLDAQLESQSRVLDKGFETGFGTETKAAAAGVLGALGVKDAEAYATDAQKFRGAAMDVVMQKQIQQKGPQTESDARRLEQTAAALGNTPAANKFLIDVARAQNARDIGQQRFFDDYWRKNGTYEGAENAWYSGEGGKSLFDDPRLKKYESGKPGGRSVPSVGAVQDGYRFKGGNPADPNSWQKVQ